MKYANGKPCKWEKDKRNIQFRNGMDSFVRFRLIFFAHDENVSCIVEHQKAMCDDNSAQAAVKMPAQQHTEKRRIK